MDEDTYNLVPITPSYESILAADQLTCRSAVDPKTNGPDCHATSNPITIGTGNKWLIERDVIGALRFSRSYNSNPATPSSVFGEHWMGSYTQRLSLNTPSAGNIRAIRPDGKVYSYTLSGNSYTADADITERLVGEFGSGGALIGYRLESSDYSIERYDASGRLISLTTASGQVLSMTYDASDRLSSVKDPFGRNLVLTYNASNGVATLRNPAGGFVSYSYDPIGNLTQVTYPDGKFKTYLYENPTFPYHLTGVIDERETQFSTYDYDSQGRAFTESLAGGVAAVSLNFEQDATTVTDALGNIRTYNFQTLLGRVNNTGQTQPGGAGCAASSSNIEYEPSTGNALLRDDFNGNRTCYTYTGSNYGVRNLENTRIEGLVGATGANANGTPTACSSVTPDGSVLPAGGRKVSTQWHPNWALKTQQAEPLLKTTWVYNGQPDPFNSNALANCVSAMYGATSVPTLPDGSPIAVLCKKVEQATTDANGSQGLSPTLASSTSGNPTQRQWTYTYNQYGQVLTSTDPLGKQTTNTYFQDTSFSGADPYAVGHTMGDLQSVTNPAGHVMQYTAYDKAGRVLSMTSPTGLTTAYSYWPRGWLKAVKQCDGASCDITSATGGLLTSYDYWPTGLLKTVTQPDGSTLSYAYDDAHRLVGISDAAGNTVTYTLDNAGNRIGEQVKDASGVLAKNISRSYDALNRVQSVIGSAQ